MGNATQIERVASIRMGLVDLQNFQHWHRNERLDTGQLTIRVINRPGSPGFERNLGDSGIVEIPNVEPRHFVVPYLSKRKTANYHEDVRAEHAQVISNDLTYLAAKLSRLSNSSFPGHADYVEACREILGFVVSAVPSGGGQRPGVYLKDRQTLFIDQMGEGVPSIVGLLADLTLAEGKLFLIEEPENDLHPRALKALLELILVSSKSNQFVVSTHSNIVVRYLASAPNSVLFNVSATKESFPPVASITPVDQTVAARMAVLRDLGYAFADFDLWDGWLILEESSAERLIRDYLIPWFFPRLTRVRTVAVGGTGNVAPTFHDFQRLVRFTHLEQAYRDVVWVRVDGDTSGLEVVKALRTGYPGWVADRFGWFKERDFEKYYPREFSAQAEAALALQDKKARRAAKATLLDQVRAWLDADVQRAKTALQESAAEVIADLAVIDQQLREAK